jgi:TusA-related sulfurtransferase
MPAMWQEGTEVESMPNGTLLLILVNKEGTKTEETFQNQKIKLTDVETREGFSLLYIRAVIKVLV